MVKPLHYELGLRSEFMMTMHAYTNDRQLTDSYQSDRYRSRSAIHSMITTKISAASAIAKVLQELTSKLNGSAVQVPTINISLVDLTFNASRETRIEEVNQLLKSAAATDLYAVLDHCDEPLKSSDFHHSSYSCNFDATQKFVNGSLSKITTWYDCEWGGSNRLLDSALALANSDTGALA